MGKAYYGISERTGKTIIIGDEDNFPKKSGNPVFMVVTVFSIAAVIISFVLIFAPKGQ